MNARDVFAHARDAFTVKQVFGEPYEKDGLTVIAVARVRGGAGGGEGEGPPPEGKGSGGGFAMHAGPVGVYVLHGDEVSWRPALDVNRIILGGQIVAVVTVLTMRSIAKYRLKARG